MKKEDFLGKIEQGIHWEDEFILKYDDDAVWELLKTLPKEKFREIKRLFSRNISDTRTHFSILKGLIEDVRSGKHEL